MLIRWIAAFLVLLPLASRDGLSQLAPSPDASPVSHAPAAPEEDKSVATFKLQVNLVDVFFTVKDKNNNLVPHLNKDDCTVFEDKHPQTWKSFIAENNLPLTLGILLDTSGSQQYVLPLEQRAGSDFLQRVLKAKDEAFLLSFDVNVDMLQDFTNSPRLLLMQWTRPRLTPPGVMEQQVSRAPGAAPFPASAIPKGTLLYDAIYLASREKLNQESGRKAMIILTDAEDQGAVPRSMRRLRPRRIQRLDLQP